MQLSFTDNKYARLVRICIKIHAWLGQNPHWDLGYEPPWYQEFRSALLEITQDEDEDDPRLTRKGEWISL